MGRVITVNFLIDGPSYMREIYYDAVLAKPDDRRFNASLGWVTDLISLETIDDKYLVKIPNSNNLELIDLFKWEE